MSSELFCRAGEAICGPLWQREIARRLGVSDRSVRYWIAGRPMPEGVWRELREIAEGRQTELAEVIADLVAQG